MIVVVRSDHSMTGIHVLLLFHSEGSGEKKQVDCSVDNRRWPLLALIAYTTTAPEYPHSLAQLDTHRLSAKEPGAIS